MKKNEKAFVIHGNARFTALTDGLVRMEYSKNGEFEDRPTVRITERPQGKAFDDICEAGRKIIVKNGKMTIEYTDDGYPFNACNLKVCNAETGEKIWCPGQRDSENLGGAAVSMDNVSRSIIPAGVHTATDENYDSDNYNLWNFCSAKVNNEFAVNELHIPSGEDIGLEQYLKAIDIEKMPENFKELIAARSKYPPGLLSRSGYFLYNDSESPVITESGAWFETDRAAGYTDYYLFLYGKDFRGALKDYIYLFGHTPMVPKYVFGMWFTRYPFPKEAECREMAERFAEENMPLDVMAMDLPWHKYDWLGFDWNTDCIDPKTYFTYCREHGIHNVANIHPYALPTEDSHFKEFLEKSELTANEEDILPPSLSDDSPRFTGYDMTKQKCATAFSDVFLHPLLKDGVDYFWYDGVACMGSKRLKSPQFLSNYIFRSLEERECSDRRQLMMARLGGMGGHRFPLHFTADAFSHWEVLKSQVEYTLRAGHMGYSLITHDIAGIQNYQYPFHYLDSELYCRWVQWGALSPIFRIHSSHDGVRLPWLYGDRVLKFFKKSLTLRRELLPYFYTLMYESVKEGLPMLRSCALSDPEWEKGYEIWDSYYLGDRIFVTPFLEPGGCRKVVLPKGEWYCPLTKESFVSSDTEEFTLISVEPAATPHFIRKGSVLVKREDDGKNAMANLKYAVEIYPSSYYAGCANDSITVYEDDGESCGYENGEYRLLRVTMSEANGKITVTATTEDGKNIAYLSQVDAALRLYGEYSHAPVVVQNGTKTEMRRTEDGYYSAELCDFFGKAGGKAEIIL